MKLWLIYQSFNDGYDTYDSAVVCAKNEVEAVKIHPSGTQEEGFNKERRLWYERKYKYGSWASSLDQVGVKYLGEADSNVAPGVVCASFNAG